MGKFYIQLPDGSLRKFDDTQITVDAARQVVRSELGLTLPDLDIGGFKFSPLTTLDQLATGFSAGVKDLGAGATGFYADAVDALGAGVGSLLGLPRGALVPNAVRDISLSLSQSAAADRAAQRAREAPSATSLRSVTGPMKFTDWETAPEVAGNLARQGPAALVDAAGGMLPGLLGGRAVQGLAALSAVAKLSASAKAALGAGVGIGVEALQASGSIIGEVNQEIELLARENPERLISTPKGRSAWERSGGDFERTIRILQDEASRSIGLPTIASTAAFAALTPGEARLYAGVGGGRGFAADVARAFLFEGSEEAAQEATQQAIENYGIMGIDPQRQIGDNVLESGFVGGLVGGAAGGAFEAAASLPAALRGGDRPQSSERQYAEEAAKRVAAATDQVVEAQLPEEAVADPGIAGLGTPIVEPPPPLAQSPNLKEREENLGIIRGLMGEEAADLLAGEDNATIRIAARMAREEAASVPPADQAPAVRQSTFTPGDDAILAADMDLGFRDFDYIARSYEQGRKNGYDGLGPVLKEFGDLDAGAVDGLLAKIQAVGFLDQGRRESARAVASAIRSLYPDAPPLEREARRVAQLFATRRAAAAAQQASPEQPASPAVEAVEQVAQGAPAPPLADAEGLGQDPRAAVEQAEAQWQAPPPQAPEEQQALGGAEEGRPSAGFSEALSEGARSAYEYLINLTPKAAIAELRAAKLINAEEAQQLSKVKPGRMANEIQVILDLDPEEELGSQIAPSAAPAQGPAINLNELDAAYDGGNSKRILELGRQLLPMGRSQVSEVARELPPAKAQNLREAYDAADAERSTLAAIESKDAAKAEKAVQRYAASTQQKIAPPERGSLANDAYLARVKAYMEGRWKGTKEQPKPAPKKPSKPEPKFPGIELASEDVAEPTIIEEDLAPEVPAEDRPIPGRVLSPDEVKQKLLERRKKPGAKPKTPPKPDDEATQAEIEQARTILAEQELIQEMESQAKETSVAPGDIESLYSDLAINMRKSWSMFAQGEERSPPPILSEKARADLPKIEDALNAEMAKQGLKGARVILRDTEARGLYTPGRRIITLGLGHIDHRLPLETKIYHALSTLRHETFHDLRALGLFKETELKVMLAYVKSHDYTGKPVDDVSQSIYGYVSQLPAYKIDSPNRNEKNPSPEQRLLWEEEAMAEAFRTWAPSHPIGMRYHKQTTAAYAFMGAAAGGLAAGIMTGFNPIFVGGGALIGMRLDPMIRTLLDRAVTFFRTLMRTMGRYNLQNPRDVFDNFEDIMNAYHQGKKRKRIARLEQGKAKPGPGLGEELAGRDLAMFVPLMQGPSGRWAPSPILQNVQGEIQANIERYNFLSSQGYPPAFIWQQTRIVMSPDGIPVLWLDSSQTEWKNGKKPTAASMKGGVRLGDIVTSPEWEKYIPSVMDVVVMPHVANDGNYGFFDPRTGKAHIRMSAEARPLQTLIHEIQHGVAVASRRHGIDISPGADWRDFLPPGIDSEKTANVIDYLDNALQEIANGVDPNLVAEGLYKVYRGGRGSGRGYLPPDGSDPSVLASWIRQEINRLEGVRLFELQQERIADQRYRADKGERLAQEAERGSLTPLKEFLAEVPFTEEDYLPGGSVGASGGISTARALGYRGQDPIEANEFARTWNKAYQRFLDGNPPELLTDEGRALAAAPSADEARETARKLEREIEAKELEIAQAKREAQEAEGQSDASPIAGEDPAQTKGGGGPDMSRRGFLGIMGGAAAAAGMRIPPATPPFVPFSKTKDGLALKELFRTLSRPQDWSEYLGLDDVLSGFLPDDVLSYLSEIDGKADQGKNTLLFEVLRPISDPSESKSVVKSQLWKDYKRSQYEMIEADTASPFREYSPDAVTAAREKMQSSLDALVDKYSRPMLNKIKARLRVRALEHSLIKLVKSRDNNKEPRQDTREQAARQYAHAYMSTPERMARARELGYRVDNILLHGAPYPLQGDGFNEDFMGTRTSGAKPGEVPQTSERAFWFVPLDAPQTRRADYGRDREEKYIENNSLVNKYGSVRIDDNLWGQVVRAHELRAIERFGEGSWPKPGNPRWDEWTKIIQEEMKIAREVTHKTEPVIVPVFVRGKFATIEKEIDWKQQNEMADPDDETYVSRVLNNARRKGLDGVIFKKMVDGTGIIGQQWAILNPSNIRSIHAAFDPDFADSTNILASRANIGKDILDPVRSFVNGNKRNAWIEAGPFKAYLRKSQRKGEDGSRISAIDVANIEASTPGTGRFGEFMDAIEAEARKAGIEAAFVESIINERLPGFLGARGYSDTGLTRAFKAQGVEDFASMFKMLGEDDARSIMMSRAPVSLTPEQLRPLRLYLDSNEVGGKTLGLGPYIARLTKGQRTLGGSPDLKTLEVHDLQLKAGQQPGQLQSTLASMEIDAARRGVEAVVFHEVTLKDLERGLIAAGYQSYKPRPLASSRTYYKPLRRMDGPISASKAPKVETSLDKAEMAREYSKWRKARKAEVNQITGAYSTIETAFLRVDRQQGQGAQWINDIKRSNAGVTDETIEYVLLRRGSGNPTPIDEFKRKTFTRREIASLINDRPSINFDKYADNRLPIGVYMKAAIQVIGEQINEAIRNIKVGEMTPIDPVLGIISALRDVPEGINHAIQDYREQVDGVFSQSAYNTMLKDYEEVMSYAGKDESPYQRYLSAIARFRAQNPHLPPEVIESKIRSADVIDEIKHAPPGVYKVVSDEKYERRMRHVPLPPGQWSKYFIKGGDNYRERVGRVRGAPGFANHHFVNSPNMIFWTREMDFRRASGNWRIAGEIQSVAAQSVNAGDFMYETPGAILDIDAQKDFINKRIEKLDEAKAALARAIDGGKPLEERERLSYEVDRRKNIVGSEVFVPDMPRKKAWDEDAIGFGIYEAARDGMDYYAITEARHQNGDIFTPERTPQGMKNAYDDRYPKIVQRWAKALGTKYVESKMRVKDKNGKPHAITVRGLKLTPAVRRAILQEGVPFMMATSPTPQVVDPVDFSEHLGSGPTTLFDRAVKGLNGNLGPLNWLRGQPWASWWYPLGDLPYQNLYMAGRNMTTGAVSQFQQASARLMELSDYIAAKDAKEATKDIEQFNAFIRGFEHQGQTMDQMLARIDDPQVRNAAKIVEQTFRQLGAELRDAGILTKGQVDKFTVELSDGTSRSVYVPRLFLAYLESALSTRGMMPSGRGFGKRRLPGRDRSIVAALQIVNMNWELDIEEKLRRGLQPFFTSLTDKQKARAIKWLLSDKMGPLTRGPKDSRISAKDFAEWQRVKAELKEIENDPLFKEKLGGRVTADGFEPYPDNVLRVAFASALRKDASIGRVMETDAEAGLITDPVFLASVGIMQEGKWLAVNRFMEFLASAEKQMGRPLGWIAPNTSIIFDGKMMTPYALNERLTIMEERREQSANNLPLDRFIIKVLDERIKEAKAKLTPFLVPTTDGKRMIRVEWQDAENYRQLPNTDEYGDMRGMIVHKAIYNDLRGHLGISSYNEDPIMQTLNMMYSRALSLFKRSKTTLNWMGGHVRPILGNILLAYLGGGARAIADFGHALGFLVPEVFNRTGALRKDTTFARDFKEAIDQGVLAGMMTDSDVLEGLDRLKEMQRRINASTKKNMRTTIGGMYEGLLVRGWDVFNNKSGELYNAYDVALRFAIWRQYKRKGYGTAEAMMQAERFAPDYSLVPAPVRLLRSSGLMPFATYPYKLTMTLPEMMVDGAVNAVEGARKGNPNKLSEGLGQLFRAGLMSASLTGILWAVGAAMGGLDEEEEKALRQAMSNEMRKNVFIIPLPDGKGGLVRDEEGRIVMVPYSWMIPWSSHAQVVANAARGATSGSDGGFAMPNVDEAARTAGLANPFIDIYTLWSSGYDPGAGRQVFEINPLTPEVTERERWNATGEKIFTTIAPPTLPTIQTMLDRAAGDGLDNIGRPVQDYPSLLARLFGVGPAVLNVEDQHRRNIARVQNTIRELNMRKNAEVRSMGRKINALGPDADQGKVEQIRREHMKRINDHDKAIRDQAAQLQEYLRRVGPILEYERTNNPQ